VRELKITHIENITYANALKELHKRGFNYVKEVFKYQPIEDTITLKELSDNDKKDIEIFIYPTDYAYIMRNNCILCDVVKILYKED
jgi:hypothetical protein